MKFCIIWENLGTVSNDAKTDFIEYLTPYWIEYYFKDPRYYKIDGRPLFSIYRYDNFVSEVGGIEIATELIEQFKQRCIDAGVGEPILTTSGTSLTGTAKMETMTAAGWEMTGNYGWGFNSTVDYQKKILSAQKKMATDADSSYRLDVNPLIGVGFDSSAWENAVGGVLLKPEEYQELLQWTKDELLPGLSTGRLSKQPILLGSWNEYAEGHYICPSVGSGFGFLDAVYNVFCEPDGEHKDVIPTDKQKDRFNNLYPFERKLRYNPYAKYSFNFNKEIPENVKYGWYFNSAEEVAKWTPGGHVGDFHYDENGYATGVIKNYDSMISSPSVNIDISDVTYIKIEMKTDDSISFLGELFFTTEEDGSINAAKSVNFPTDKDGEWQTHYIPVYQNRNWKGVLTKLRLDPALYAGGSFSIKSIELLSEDPDKVYENTMFLTDYLDTQYFTGTILRESQPQPVVINETLMLPLRYVSTMLSGSVDYEAATNEIFLNHSGNVYAFSEGSDVAKLGVKKIFLEEKVYVDDDGNSYIPLSFVNENLDVEMEWQDEYNVLKFKDAVADQYVKPEKAEPRYKRELLKSWEFNTNDDFEGWSLGSHMKNGTVNNGVLKADIVGNDPLMQVPVSISADTVKNICIGVKNNTPAANASIFWLNESVNTYGNDLSHEVILNTNDSKITEYNIDTADISNWDGTISKFRFDPAIRNGTTEIDYIRLEGDYTNELVVEQEQLETAYKISDSSIVWDFDYNDSITGWRLSDYLANSTIINGKLYSKLAGPNVYLETYDGFSQDFKLYDKLKFRITNYTDAEYVKLCFKTEGEEKCINVEITPDSSKPETYYADISELDLLVTGIKLEFENNTSGEFFMDYIKLYKSREVSDETTN